MTPVLTEPGLVTYRGGTCAAEISRTDKGQMTAHRGLLPSQVPTNGHVWDDGRGMNREKKLQVTFNDGGVRYLTTQKAFTHAWRITGVLTSKRPAEITGWARS